MWDHGGEGGASGGIDFYCENIFLKAVACLIAPTAASACAKTTSSSISPAVNT